MINRDKKIPKQIKAGQSGKQAQKGIEAGKSSKNARVAQRQSSAFVMQWLNLAPLKSLVYQQFPAVKCFKMVSVPNSVPKREK